MTGALQDHDRALVMGEPSFGKGLVQTVYPLSEHAGLALTRGLGRRGVPVHGITLHDTEFGLRSRYLVSRRCFDGSDEAARDAALLARLRAISEASGERLVLTEVPAYQHLAAALEALKDTPAAAHERRADLLWIVAALAAQFQAPVAAVAAEMAVGAAPVTAAVGAAVQQVDERYFRLQLAGHLLQAGRAERGA